MLQVGAIGKVQIFTPKGQQERIHRISKHCMASFSLEEFPMCVISPVRYLTVTLPDESGWAWLIPLHDGTTSVGVVMYQDFATSKKREASSSEDFYLSSIALAPNIQKLLKDGTLVSDLRSASDFSYSASSYASPYLRIVGDAGCFIDPFFSSGVHLAMVSALSAATTICAAIRGDCKEQEAAEWHSTKVADGYTRFLLVVLSAYKQIRSQNQPVLSDLGEDNLDRAFAHFRPGIYETHHASPIPCRFSHHEQENKR